MQSRAPQRIATQGRATHRTAEQSTAEHSNALGFQPSAPLGGLLGGYPPDAPHRRAGQGTALQRSAMQSNAPHSTAGQGNALEILASAGFLESQSGWDFHLMQSRAKQGMA